jgi:hypothetical protein
VGVTDAQPGVVEFVMAEPLHSDAVVKGAPFSAEAINEFTQLLPDGNRIERRYTTSIWRDSQGRVRREQQVALVGPLATHGEPPRLVTISDPVTRTVHTLNVENGTTTSAGRLSVMSHVVRGTDGRGPETTEEIWVVRDGQRTPGRTIEVRGQVIGGRMSDAPVDAPGVKTESLGTRSFDGVRAEGTRTTMTIPAGEIGNVAPIDVVTERWFSPELQMVVMLSRRDPRSGDTVYRLTNVIRAEPPAHLFDVPLPARPQK